MIRDTFSPSQWPALPGLLEALPVGILLYNCQGECLSANATAQHLLGRTALDDLNLPALVAAPNGQSLPVLATKSELPPQQTLRDGAPHTAQVVVEHNEKRSPLEMSAMAVETPALDGICTLVVLRDTANEQHMQQRVEDLQRHLRRMMYNEPAQGASAAPSSAQAGSTPNTAEAAGEGASPEQQPAPGENLPGFVAEMSTPVSTVKAGISNILRGLPEALPELMRVLNNLPADVRENFIQLMGEALNDRQPLSTREERQKRKQIKTQLDELGVPEALDKVKGLVEVQVFDDLQRFEALLKHPEATRMIQLCARFSGLRRNALDVDTAAGSLVQSLSAMKQMTKSTEDA